jgi:hypothetical protein
MDLDTMIADAAPARHATLDGPDSPAATRLYQAITVAPPPVARTPRRTRFPALAVLTAAAAGLAAAATLILIPGAPVTGPHAPHGVRAQLAAWSVDRQPDGRVVVTIRELRDPVGLWRTLRADGIPANVRFLPHYFMGTTSVSAIPRVCRVARQPGPASEGRIVSFPPSMARGGEAAVVLAIRPSAIPHGVGLYLKAWAASPGTRSGPTLSIQTDLVQASPQCTGRHP